VQQTNVRVGALYDLAIELEYQTQNAVGRRVLRAKVQGVVFNFCHVDSHERQALSADLRISLRE
ncbi:MAG: hypothetical protein RL529_596, partial [Actinomycetota bacterium]